MITFRTYGTWLPGDSRGSIEKARKYPDREQVRLPPNDALRNYAHSLLEHPPVYLTDPMRAVVRDAFSSLHSLSRWKIGAVNVLCAHVHVACAVLGMTAQQARRILKGRATRALVDAELVDEDTHVWAGGGHFHSLETNRACRNVVRYVLERQECSKFIWPSEDM